MPRPELAHVPEYQRYFDEPAGREHYRLLEELSEAYEGDVVVDVGTLYGSSALALAANPKVQVWTYDIRSHVPETAGVREVPNISFRIKDGIEAVPDFVDKTSLILLDVDPHDGEQEARFFEALAKHGYRGDVVCDDIHLNPAMKAWWESVTLPKEDLTHKGHWSGTGIVHFQ